MFSHLFTSSKAAYSNIFHKIANNVTIIPYLRTNRYNKYKNSMSLTVKSINLKYSPMFGYTDWTATFNEITRQFEGSNGVGRDENGVANHVTPYSRITFCDTYINYGRTAYGVKIENYNFYKSADTKKGVKGVYPEPELCEFEGIESIAFGHWLSSARRNCQWHIRNLNKIRETGVLIAEDRDMIPFLIGKAGVNARKIESLLGMKKYSLNVIHISEMEDAIRNFQKNGGQLTVDDSLKQKTAITN